MKKLTGREAVKALMDGKKVRRMNKYGETQTASFGDFDYQIMLEVVGEEKEISQLKGVPLHEVVLNSDWEIVQEPMVWEGEHLVTEFDKTDESLGGIIRLNANFIGKRVKVRIEEVLE